VLVAVGAAFLAGGLAFLLTAGIGRHAARLVSTLPYGSLSIGVLGMVTALVVLLHGLPGLLLFVTGTALGSVGPRVGAARAHAMACILVPVGLRFVTG
jgi:TctA family transporter